MSDQNSESQSSLDDRFVAIVDQSPFSIQILSPDGFTLRVNKAWEKLWGMTLEQLRDYNMLEDRQLEKHGVMPYIKRAFAGELAEIPPIPYDPVETLQGISSNDDTVRWTRAVIYPIKDAGGKVLEVVLMHEDITEQIRGEEKLRESEARYRLLFETSLDGIMIVDGNGKYIDVNESLCRILKTPREKLVGSHFSEYMIPERIEDARQAFSALQSTGFYTGDFPMRAGDGSAVELTWSSRADFMPGLHVCVARDISERKRSENALRESEERYRSLLENANDIIYSHDLAGKYLTINRAGERITGYTQEEILRGMSVTDTIVPEHLERARQMTEHKLLDPNTATLYEIDIFAKDGRRLTLEVSTRISHKDGKPVAVEGVARDITERKRIEIEKLQLAAQLEKQRKHLQEMVSDVPAIVWETLESPDSKMHRLDFVSDYVENLLGYSVEEWLTTPDFWISIIHPDDKKMTMHSAAEIFAGRDPEPIRFRLIAKNGRVVWVETQSVPICDDHGNPIGLRGVTTDITERKQKEENQRFLAEASTVLASSFDYETTLSTFADLAVPHFADWCSVDIARGDGLLHQLAVAHIDPAKVAWSQEINERYPPAQHALHGLYNVFRTEKSEFYPEITDEMLAERAHDAEHLELLRRVGFRSVMIVPLKIREKVLGVLTFVNAESGRQFTTEDLAMAEDLANRAALAVDNARLYQAEQQSRLAAERNSNHLQRLQSVFEPLAQALSPQQVSQVVIEQAVNSLGAHAGIVVLLNDSARELEIIGAMNFLPDMIQQWRKFPLDQKVPISDAICLSSPVVIESFAELNERYPQLGPLASVNGSQALAAFPLIVQGRTLGALGLSFPQPQNFSIDDLAFMTALAQQCAQSVERARLYETEQILRKQAEDANRMKDEFLATLSHELRTPLNSILGWSQMLQNGDLESATREKALAIIERNALAQNQLIDDILDVSRIITGKLRLDIRPLHLTGVISAAAESLKPAIEAKNIRLRTLFDLQTGLIQGDAGRLQQVVWNLLSNAVKFTPAGGDIEIRLQHNGAHVEIIVSDTGIGIEAEFLPHVFDRFRQFDGSTTRRQGGLGLGLAIVRQLVEMHGGNVRAENNNGQGAVFTVELPAITEEESFANTENGLSSGRRTGLLSETAQKLSGLRILIVDDEEDSSELARVVLSGGGAEVMTASSVPEAFHLIERQRFDLIISDIGMPGEDGFSLLGKIRALPADHGREVPVIALTAYARNEDRVKSLNAGFQMHISKPFEPTKLIAAAAQLTERD